jgi:hypothetical protein
MISCVAFVKLSFSPKELASGEGRVGSCEEAWDARRAPVPDPLIGHDEIEGQNRNTPQRIQPHTGDGKEAGRHRWLYLLIPLGLIAIFIAIYSSMQTGAP